MAKSKFSKFLTGVVVVSAGVALGLAIYNKLDSVKHELENDEFEDDDFYDDDITENTYVVINASDDDSDEEICEECAEEDVDASSDDAEVEAEE